jgi:iron complex outermembrane receptor protein
VQSDFKGEVLGRELRLNAGVRYSGPRPTGYRQLQEERRRQYLYAPNQEKGSYKNLLPAVSGAYDLTDQLIWRASYGKTISRASLSIIAARP